MLAFRQVQRFFSYKKLAIRNMKLGAWEIRVLNSQERWHQGHFMVVEQFCHHTMVGTMITPGTQFLPYSTLCDNVKFLV